MTTWTCALPRASLSHGKRAMGKVNLDPYAGPESSPQTTPTCSPWVMEFVETNATRIVPCRECTRSGLCIPRSHVVKDAGTLECHRTRESISALCSALWSMLPNEGRVAEHDRSTARAAGRCASRCGGRWRRQCAARRAAASGRRAGRTPGRARCWPGGRSARARPRQCGRERCRNLQRRHTGDGLCCPGFFQSIACTFTTNAAGEGGNGGQGGRGGMSLSSQAAGGNGGSGGNGGGGGSGGGASTGAHQRCRTCWPRKTLPRRADLPELLALAALAILPVPRLPWRKRH